MKLKELREINKISQHKLSKNLNINVMTYNGWENEKTEPNIKNLIKLADYYQVSLDYLVGRKFNNDLDYLTENQVKFIKTFLALNEENQMNAVIYVAEMLSKQK